MRKCDKAAPKNPRLKISRTEHGVMFAILGITRELKQFAITTKSGFEFFHGGFGSMDMYVSNRHKYARIATSMYRERLLDLTPAADQKLFFEFFSSDGNIFKLIRFYFAFRELFSELKDFGYEEIDPIHYEFWLKQEQKG